MDIGPGKVLPSYLLMRSWFIAVNNGMGEAVRCMDNILGLKNDKSYSLLLTDCWRYLLMSSTLITGSSGGVDCDETDVRILGLKCNNGTLNFLLRL